MEPYKITGLVIGVILLVTGLAVAIWYAVDPGSLKTVASSSRRKNPTLSGKIGSSAVTVSIPRVGAPLSAGDVQLLRQSASRAYSSNVSY